MSGDITSLALQDRLVVRAYMAHLQLLTGVQLPHVGVDGVEQRHAVLVPDDRRPWYTSYWARQVCRVVLHYLHRLQIAAVDARRYCDQQQE